MRARILPPTLENILLAADAIRAGEIVGMPTETVYGLAGDARSPLALAKIFETKERPTFDPLILHVGPFARGIQFLDQLRLIDTTRISGTVRTKADRLIEKFWPGPLTLVLPKHADIPDLATSGLSTVALRMPRHPIAQALINESQTPLAAPSANRFGRISPTTAEAVLEELGDRIDWIVDGGACEIGLESTVVGFNENGEVLILRQGGTTPEELEACLQEKVLTGSDERITSAAPSPGLLESHYAPRKPLFILPKPVFLLDSEDLKTIQEKSLKLAPQGAVGLLLFSGAAKAAQSWFSERIHRPVLARTLSIQGDLRESAQNLFAEMRALDASEAQVLWAEPCLKEEGLGFAIADRLKRASAKWSTFQPKI